MAFRRQDIHMGGRIEGGAKLKTAVVTGASSGIGKAIAEKLIQRDYKVIGLGRNFDKWKDTTNVEQWNPITIDLMDTVKVEQTIRDLLKKEEIVMLVNAAGVGYFAPHEELNRKKIHEMVTVNLEVPLLLTQLLLRTLKKNNGYIMNISSITAKKENTYGCAYGATKAGLSSFGKSLFEEARKYGIHVTNIHPDMTKSDFYRNANFDIGLQENSYLLAKEVAECVDYILEQRDGVVVPDITIRPQLHQLTKK